jgi:ADP-heptose:LPS heptosyltransferase
VKNFQSILIFHAAAIGDAVLATPVAVKLKAAFPQSKISYLTHESLFPLLELCSAIDTFHPYYKKDSVFTVRNWISSIKPELIVDLSGSMRSFLRTTMLAEIVLHYRKQGEKSRQMIHAVDNFLKTVERLSVPDTPIKFPTLKSSRSALEAAQKLTGGSPCIAMVPGVGTLRPHRAWTSDKWISLAGRLIEDARYKIILVGGPEDQQLCDQIERAIGSQCMNIAGKKSLPETAAILQTCLSTISGDTGPAHISVAVGTPVLGIYGPTFPARSGPYGTSNSTIDFSDNCRCHRAKHCLITGPGSPADCLKQVAEQDVYDRLMQMIQARPKS